MSFPTLITTSLVKRDSSYLYRVPTTLMTDEEQEAVSWIRDYQRRHGELPTPGRMQHSSYSSYVDKAFVRKDPLSDIFDDTIMRMKWRYFSSQIRQIEVDELPDGSLNAPALRTLAGVVGADYSSTPISFKEFDRQTLYDPAKGHSLKLGFDVIDTFMGGLFGGECLFLVARPGRGKTMLVCDIAINWARQGQRVVFNSIEMPVNAIVARLDSLLGEFNPMLLRTKTSPTDLKAAKDKVTNNLSALGEGDILFPPRYCKTPMELEAFCQEANATAVIADGMYLFHPDTANKNSTRDWQSIAGVTSGLKELARNLNVPLIGTTQLKRNGEENADIDDVAFSDAFGQDADVVMTMVPSGDDMSVSLAKNRNGKQGHGQIINLDIEHGKIKKSISAGM